MEILKIKINSSKNMMLEIRNSFNNRWAWIARKYPLRNNNKRNYTKFKCLNKILNHKLIQQKESSKNQLQVKKQGERVNRSDIN